MTQTATLQGPPYQAVDGWRAPALVQGVHHSVVITDQHKDRIRGAKIEVRQDQQGRWVTQ